MDLLELTSILANLCIIGVSAWLVVKYLKVMSVTRKVKNYLNMYMDIDKIIGDIEKLEVGEPAANEPAIQPYGAEPSALTGCGAEPQAYRDRLIAVAASGNAKLYLGKNITTSEIENLEN